MTEAKLRRRISDCMFSAKPFHSSHFNTFRTRYALFLSQGWEGEFLGKLSSAQGCLQCQRIPRRRRNTLQISRDAVITHWGSFGSRDLPQYATSTKLQIRQRADGYRAELPYRVEKPKRVEGCDGVDKRATPKPLPFAMSCQQYSC